MPLRHAREIARTIVQKPRAQWGCGAQGAAVTRPRSHADGADLAQAEKALASAELDIARNRAIADALSGMGLHFVAPAGTSSEIAETQRRLIAAQLAEIEATAASLASARSTALSDAQAARAKVAWYADTVPILDRQIERMNRLDASRDALQDKDLGLVYVATIALDRAIIDADGRRYALTPGLAATVDVRIGTRAIISYPLSPLQKSIAQSGRER